VDQADAILLRELSSGFEIILASLLLVQKRLLQALARAPTDQPYGTDFLSRSQLSVGAVQKAVRVLVDFDLIERWFNRQYQLIDVLLTQWRTQRPPMW